MISETNEDILERQIEIDQLQAKVNKKRETNQAAITLDEEALYAKKLALAKILEV